MAPLRDDHPFHELYTEELTRAARLLVDVRAEKAPLTLIPLGLLAALDPRPIRVVLLAGCFFVMVTLSRVERQSFLRDGLSPTFITKNALAMGGVHTFIYLLTGGLFSPLVPVLVVFTFALSIVLGESAARRHLQAFQTGVVGVLALAQPTGLTSLLSPPSLRLDFSLLHMALVASFIALLLRLVSNWGARLRRLFDEIVGRIAIARHELLLTQQAQTEELTALSGAIAHELKNPLASVKGLASLLSRDLPEGKPAERLGVLRREVDRMQGILEEFLNFSRPSLPLAREALDLGALAADVVSLHEGLARERGVRLSAQGSALALGDARKTRQVLVNLLQNALDASSSGGAVSLHSAPGPDGAVLTVEDEGQGLDPGLAARVFEPGVTTKARGSGLGLTIARGLARQQGGDLVLEARAPRGCLARLRLPAAVPA